MNENQEFQEATAAVTPPPFRHNQESADHHEPTASPTLAQRIAAMGLDETMTQRLGQLTQHLDATLIRGITHDEDVSNADAAGYLRGRNEKIEAVMHPQPQDDEEQQATPVFPRYCRRSIWD